MTTSGTNNNSTFKQRSKATFAVCITIYLSSRLMTEFRSTKSINFQSYHLKKETTNTNINNMNINTNINMNRTAKISNNQHSNLTTTSTSYNQNQNPMIQESSESELTHVLRDKLHTFMNTSIAQRSLPPHTPGAFLHVGKAAGSTLCSVLQNSCHSFVRKPCKVRTKWEDGTLNETYVGALTTYIHTPDFSMLGQTQTPGYSNFAFYIANLRDPFTKFLSVFTYSHPENNFERFKRMKRLAKECKQFYSCFPSLERFIELVGDHPSDFDYPYDANTIETSNCTNLARAAMANKVKGCAEHMYWNTKSILERIPGWNSDINSNSNSNSNYYDDNKDDTGISSSVSNATASSRHHSRPSIPPPFVAIRTEHLKQDFVSANQVLGDPHPLSLEAAGVKNDRVQSVPKMKVSKNITSVGRTRLCKALLPEYKAYIKALSRAINLSDRDRQTSLELSQRMCPDLTWLFQDDLMMLRWRRH